MNRYTVEVRNLQTGDSKFTAGMSEKNDALTWAARYLGGPIPADETARIWEQPQTKRNRGGALNRVIWDSRFPHDLR